MTGWRDRLAAIRARPAAPTDPAPTAAEAIGTTGASDIGMETAKRAAPLAPPLPVWPDGFLYLSGLAVRLDAALRDGAAVVRCPSGALDLTLPDGRAWLLSPDTVARLAAAWLLPPDLAGEGGGPGD
jgi:hypothetical protein